MDNVNQIVQESNSVESVTPRNASVRWLLGLSLVSTVLIAVIYVTSLVYTSANPSVTNVRLANFVGGLSGLTFVLTLGTIIFGIVSLFKEQDRLVRKWIGLIFGTFMVLVVGFFLLMFTQLLGGMNG